MTTSVRELMLFGGWAKVQIHSLTEDGVLTILDTAFVSTLEVKPVLKLKIYYTEDNYRRGVVTDYDEYGETYRRDATDKENYLWVKGEVKNLLQDHFKRSAIIRFVQVWGNGKISKKRFVRAFLGTHKLLESLSGVIGAFNNSKKVVKITEDEWEVPGIDEIYKNVRRLDATGVETVQKRAWANKQQRQSNI